MKSQPGKILSAIFKVVLPFALTVVLLVYLFRKVDFRNMMDIISHGVDYWWILFAMLLSVISHVIRAARWRLQLDSMGIFPPFMALCCSIFGCYALNLLFPRLGDLWRCTYIAKRENAQLTKVLGSMVADRLSDSVAVGVLLLLTFILAAPALNSFLAKYPVGRDLLGLLTSPVLWAGVLVCVLAVWGIIRYGRRYSPVRKMIEWGKQIWDGFAAVGTMKGRGRFLVLTLLLWSCYYFQLYVAFFAFPFTRELCADPSLGYGLVPCLVAFVFSAIGMAIPSNGGLGPWNIAIMFGLSIYGISDAMGTAFSMVQWSGQTVMLVILGIYTMAYITLKKNVQIKKNVQR